MNNYLSDLIDTGVVQVKKQKKKKKNLRKKNHL